MDLVAQKVLARHKLAAERLWDGALRDIQQFNKKYQEAQHADVKSEAGQKLLNDFAFRKDGTAPSFPGTAFHEWMSKAFGMMDIDDPDALRPRGPIVLGIADGKGDYSIFLEDLDAYAKALNDVVKTTAPEQFTYYGFKIQNLDHFGDLQARRLLEGIDYVVALFKKRGLDHLLKEGITQVNLAFDLGGGTLGLYFAHSREISLSREAIGRGTGRFMKWVNEVFLHEFGHYVHMNYLSKEAVEVWDSAWEEVKDKKKLYAEAFKSVTAAERSRFFDVLNASDWDPSKASKKLEPVAKVKFGVWLRSPLIGSPLITDKQFRWTKDGQRLAAYFKNPQQFIADNYDLRPNEDGYLNQEARSDKQMRDKIGLLYSGGLPISPDIVEELSKADPSMQKTVDDALVKLEVVSPYGKTNEYEDFAESFVAFVGAPEKLTPTAKFRMQQALSLSGLYGKQVMRLAQRLSINLP